MSAWRHMAVLGDSFCAGISSDVHPPWPLIVARAIRAACPELIVTDTSVTGATTSEVTRQLPGLIDEHPDLVALSVGANDVLWTTSPDHKQIADAIEKIFSEMRLDLPAATVMTPTYADFPSHIPFRPRSRRRVAEGMRHLNAAIRRNALRHGFVLVDAETIPASARRGAFATDGLHASRTGHERIAHLHLARLDQAAGRQMSCASAKFDASTTATSTH